MKKIILLLSIIFIAFPAESRISDYSFKMPQIKKKKEVKEQKSIDRAILRVNNRLLLESELQELVELAMPEVASGQIAQDSVAMMHYMILTQVINHLVMLDLAEKEGITSNAHELNFARRNALRNKSLIDLLRRKNSPKIRAWLDKRLSEGIIIKKYLAKRLGGISHISDAEALAYYSKTKKLFRVEPSMRIMAVSLVAKNKEGISYRDGLVKVMESGLGIVEIEKLLKKENQAKAKVYAQSDFPKSESEKKFFDENQEAIKSLRPGEIRVSKEGDYYELVKLESRTLGYLPEFKEVKDFIKLNISQEVLDKKEIQKLIEKEKEGQIIEIYQNNE